MKRSLKKSLFFGAAFVESVIRISVVLRQYVVAYMYAEKTLMPVCIQRVRVEGTFITNI